MRYPRLGKTDLEGSAIAFGTWSFGGDWGTFDTAEATKTIQGALERGITLFDTALGYGFGVAERLLGDALWSVARREDVIVATKSGLRMEGLAAYGPVETLQPPYHMFRRDIEAEVLPYAEEHDIGVLAYGPLAHGLLSGTMTPTTTFDRDDWRSHSSDFTGETFQRNLRVVDRLKEFAEEHGITLPSWPWPGHCRIPRST